VGRLRSDAAFGVSIRGGKECQVVSLNLAPAMTSYTSEIMGSAIAVAVGVGVGIGVSVGVGVGVGIGVSVGVGVTAAYFMQRPSCKLSVAEPDRWR
jgi:hypothetical protein